MGVRSAVLLCAGMFVGPAGGRLAAQGRPSVDAVIEVAVPAVLDSVSLSAQGADTVYVDLSALSTDVDEASVAAHLTMGQARQVDAVRCPPLEGRERVKNCFIEGADYLVTVHRVTMSGQTAAVEVEVQGEHEGNDYRSLWSGGWLVLLTWDGTEWSISEIRPLWQT